MNESVKLSRICRQAIMLNPLGFLRACQATGNDSPARNGSYPSGRSRRIRVFDHSALHSFSL